MTVHGRYTGVLRDDFGPVWDAHTQDYPETAAFRMQTMPRRAATADAVPLTSGTMLATALHLQQGDIVTNLTFASGDTGAASPANWWFALYSSDATPALLAQTADQGTANWGARTAKTLPLASPVTIDSGGVYYAAVMVAAATALTLAGCAGTSQAILEGDPVLASTLGNGLTTTAPATISGATPVDTIPLVAAT